MFLGLIKDLINYGDIMKNRCIKTCKCEDCELCRKTEIVCDLSKGFMEIRRIGMGFKCGATGFVAHTREELKNSTFSDDFLFGEEAEKFLGGE